VQTVLVIVDVISDRHMQLHLREARKEYPQAHLWKHRGCWGKRGMIYRP
jgi:hypothetical protein